DLSDPTRTFAQHLPAGLAQRTQHHVMTHSAPPHEDSEGASTAPSDLPHLSVAPAAPALERGTVRRRLFGPTACLSATTSYRDDGMAALYQNARGSISRGLPVLREDGELDPSLTVRCGRRHRFGCSRRGHETLRGDAPGLDEVVAHGFESAPHQVG